MARKVIDIDDGVIDEIARLADLHGEPENAFISAALKSYLLGGEERPEITDPDEVAAIRAEAAGMWKDRADLPDVRELRAGWGRRMSRLFGDDQ